MHEGAAGACTHTPTTARGHPNALTLQRPALRAGAMQPEGQVSALTAGDTVSEGASQQQP